MAADHRDLLDTAWSAIAEAVYAASEPPTEHDLLAVGKGAIWDIVKDHRKTYGYADREWDAGYASAPRFVTYWLELTGVTPSPEQGIVERLTVPRLLDALKPHERAAVAALAAHSGDRVAAAAALGITENTFNRRIWLARRTCLALWLEGETPARTPLRRLDRRNHRGEVAPHGTPAAGRRHQSRREPLCEPCRAAMSAYDRARRGPRGKAAA
jgi:hypothetical protein